MPLSQPEVALAPERAEAEFGELRDRSAEGGGSSSLRESERGRGEGALERWLWGLLRTQRKTESGKHRREHFVKHMVV